MQRSRIFVVAGMLWLGLVSPAAAQLAGVQPVVEVGQQLIQTTITAVEAVLQTFNQVLELTPVDEFILGGEFTSTLDEVSVIIAEATGLAYDLGSLNGQISALFDLDTAPNSMTLLKERLAEIKRVAWQGHVTALRAQTLARTTLSAIQHLLRLMEALGGLLGNMSANQTMTQVQGTMTELLAKMQVQMATYDRSRSVEHITQAMTLESLRLIHLEIMADHPVR
jgi:conjugal transfer/entry exclusion protein